MEKHVCPSITPSRTIPRSQAQPQTLATEGSEAAPRPPARGGFGTVKTGLEEQGPAGPNVTRLRLDIISTPGRDHTSLCSVPSQGSCGLTEQRWANELKRQTAKKLVNVSLGEQQGFSLGTGNFSPFISNSHLPSSLPSPRELADVLSERSRFSLLLLELEH